uniref:Spermatophylax protein 2a n=1 Tax=Gryllodes sigillatus TaxID=13551 RepID=A0A0P0AJL9_9ORTH|nr:spermatophylax protein 2a [Gryllodes sigillatus]
MRCVAVLAMLLVVLLGAEATSPSLESLAEKKDQLVQLAQKAWNTAVNVGDKVVDKAADVADVVLGVSEWLSEWLRLISPSNEGGLKRPVNVSSHL